MKITQVEALLTDVSRTISLRHGVFTVKKSYFYRNGMTAGGLWDRVQAKIAAAQLVDCGDHWHEFVGGAKSGSAKDSYFWVKFSLI